MSHVSEWTVHVYLFEQDDDSTLARAELDTQLLRAASGDLAALDVPAHHEKEA